MCEGRIKAIKGFEGRLAIGTELSTGAAEEMSRGNVTEVPVVGRSLNPAWKLFGFKESHDKNQIHRKPDSLSFQYPWNCLCGFCFLNRDAVKQAPMDNCKKWRTYLVRMFLVQAKVLLCLFLLVVLPSLFGFCKFSNSIQVWLMNV